MTTQSSDKKVPLAVRKGANPIQSFQGEMNKLFQDFFGETLPHIWHASEAYMPFSASPATDVIETEKDFRITSEVPGMDAKDITITISDDYITVKGEKKDEEKEEKNGYFRQERSYGAFQRVVALPPHLANTEKAEASVSKGLLTITIPKKAGAQTTTRKLEIKQVA